MTADRYLIPGLIVPPMTMSGPVTTNGKAGFFFFFLDSKCIFSSMGTKKRGIQRSKSAMTMKN